MPPGHGIFVPMTNMPEHSETSSNVEQLRAERDWLLEELELSRKALVAEQETQHSAHGQLVELERARAFDEISRGIEHGLFNKLTPIEGFAELLLADENRASDPEQVKEYLKIILHAAQDAKNVIGSMRESYNANSVDFVRHRSVGEMLFGALNDEDVEGADDDNNEMATDALTPREWDVLRLLSDGRRNREIAETLKVSENTIKTLIKAILSKLGLKNRTQAAAYASLDEQAFDEPGPERSVPQNRSA